MVMIENIQILTHIVFAFMLIATLGVLLLERKLPQLKQRKHLKDHGLALAPWASASGVIFGEESKNNIIHSPANIEGHTFICGGSGLGKTSALLIPTLRAWTGPFYAIDISGDISANVHPENSVTYAPCDPNTIPYNIFAMIDKLAGDTAAQNEQLEKLAYLVMPDTPGASDASLYFTTEGRKILTASLIAYYHAGLDFSDICHKIVASSWADLFREIDNQGNPVASLYINSFRGTSEQNTSGCKQAVDSVIKLFALNENVKKAIHRPHGTQIAFSPELLETTSVFFVVPDYLLDVYAPLLHIVTSQCLSYFSSRTIGATPTILFALDEFASLGKIDIIGALQKLRKRGIRIMLLVQSLADLDRIYGEVERKAMLTNFAYKVVLGAGDADTQEYFAKLIGHKKEKSISITKGSNGHSYTEQQDMVWAVEPDELGRLGKNLILIHPGGFFRLKKCYYFKYPKR